MGLRAAREGSLPLRRSKTATAGRKLETILEAVKEPLLSTCESPTGTTGGTMVVVENKSIDPEAPEDSGIVDCSCGAWEDDHGHMVKCERCGCWSHSTVCL